MKNGGFASHTFGIGDFFAESTLSWHPKQFDLAAGFGVWAPTGDSPTQPPPPPSTRIGSGYWTPMFTAGATWYVDEAKTWAVSALNRYEFNTEQRDTHITPGQAYTLEWGVSKSVCKEADLGVVGYYQQQVTANSGAAANTRNRVAAIGPEISAMFPKQMLFLSLRYNYEFMAENRMQGHTFTLDSDEAVLVRQIFRLKFCGSAGLQNSPVRRASLLRGSFRKHPVPVLRPGV